MDVSFMASLVLPDRVRLSTPAAASIETRVISVARGLASAFNLGKTRGKQGIALVAFAVYRIFKREMYEVIMSSISEYLKGPKNLRPRLIFASDLAAQFGFEAPDQDTSEIFVGCIEYATCEILQVASVWAQSRACGERVVISSKDVVAAIAKDRELSLCIIRSKEGSR